MIKLLCVGKMKDKHQRGIQEEYLKRFTRYRKVDLVEIKEANSSFEANRIIEDETSRLLAQIKTDDFVVLFDVVGKSMNSLEFSNLIEKQPKLVIVIGGSLGFDNRLRNRANVTISLSAMTFTHLLARIIVLEQLYRSFKIQTNQTYHK